MDFNWLPYSAGVWIFPLLCLLFMVVMAIMLFRRGGCCMPFGGNHRGRTANDSETARQIEPLEKSV